MCAARFSGGARLKYITHRRDHIRRALDRYALHVMFNPTDAAHFFTAARAARTAMHQ
jgi:hypothetical protein